MADRPHRGGYAAASSGVARGGRPLGAVTTAGRTAVHGAPARALVAAVLAGAIVVGAAAPAGALSYERTG
ncbi:MAG: hypothetical protein ACQETV_08210, partial [Actinomycetota bacterium]